MGCDLSKDGNAVKVSPVKEVTVQTSRPGTQYAAEKKLSTVYEEQEEMVAEAVDSLPPSPPPRPTTGWSSLGPQMDLRPPSISSNLSYTRVFSKRPSGRLFTIDTSRAKSNCSVVSLCSKKIGLTEYPNGSKGCDIYWHSHWYPDMRNIVKGGHTRVNKFPGMTELAKKIALTHAIGSMQRLFPDEYSFYPKSWFLPAHLEAFQKFYDTEKERRTRSGNTEDMWFIVKPDEGAQGTGIYLIRNPSDILDPSQKQLIQEYVADPFLMADGLKFDFRVYGVIKSINPLSLHVAREGMARFCTEKYAKPTTANMDNLYAHLTNYSLNKASDTYVHSTSLQEQVRGSKRLLSTVFHQLSNKGLRTKKLWHDIKLILVKTVLAMLPEIMLHYEHHFHDISGPQCFQIIGFDIMIRADGTPVLLEVNAAPSLSIDHSIPYPGKTLAEGEQRVPSIVDEVNKYFNSSYISDLLDEEYSEESSNTFRDDMQSLSNKRKPHLSEIFPMRYGSNSGHLLFLDKAMYIYMQFVQLRTAVTISTGGLKQFIRKCSLSDIIDQEDLEKKYNEISYGVSGDRMGIQNGLPFHAFLQLMFYIAEKKYPREPLLLSKMQRLMAYCDTSLRHFGVRSARLRRTEVDGPDLNSAVEIYMLPGRMKSKRRSKSSEPGSRKKTDSLKRDRNNNGNRLILPRIQV